MNNARCVEPYASAGWVNNHLYEKVETSQLIWCFINEKYIWFYLLKFSKDYNFDTFSHSWMKTWLLVKIYSLSSCILAMSWTSWTSLRRWLTDDSDIAEVVDRRSMSSTRISWDDSRDRRFDTRPSQLRGKQKQLLDKRDKTLNI